MHDQSPNCDFIEHNKVKVFSSNSEAYLKKSARSDQFLMSRSECVLFGNKGAPVYFSPMSSA